MKNEAKILLHVLRKKRIKRKDLEKIIDVTPSTMTYMLEKLKNYIVIEEEVSKVGKPPQFVLLSRNAWKILSISVGREKVRGVLYNARGEELEQSEYKVRSEHLSEAGIAELLKTVLDKFYDYDSIGIAFSGNVVDDKVYSKILKLNKFDPIKSLKLKQLGVPYVILSDVEAIAAYESKSTGKDKVLILNYGTGIGACYYEYRALFSREEFKDIPLGHIYFGGTEKCYCGATGCLETVASDYVLVKDYLGNKLKFVDFIEHEEEYFNLLKKVRNLFRKDEDTALKLYDKIISSLAIAVGNLSIILGINEITLYGEGSSEWLATILEKRVNDFSKNVNVHVRYGNVKDAVERGTSLEAAVVLVKKKFSK